MANGKQSVSIAPECRPGFNGTAAVIAAGTVVKQDGTNYNGIAPVAAVSDAVYGVVLAAIPVGGYGDVAIRGRVPVLAAAALTLGARVGVSAAAKASSTLAAGSSILGIACEVGAADTLTEVELLGPGAIN